MTSIKSDCFINLNMSSWRYFAAWKPPVLRRAIWGPILAQEASPATWLLASVVRFELFLTKRYLNNFKKNLETDHGKSLEISERKMTLLLS